MLRLCAFLLWLALESFVRLGLKASARAGAFVFGFVATPFIRLRQRRIRKRRLKELGIPEEGEMGKLTEIVGKLRTSTKGGAAGLLAPLVIAIPFYDQINAFVVRACQSEDGPIVFLAGAAITWVSFFVTARLAKTPANPGKL